MDELIVVTGGSKGIGKAIVEKFLSEGYPVATCSRNQADLDALKEEMDSRYGSSLHVFAADLSSRNGVDAFAVYVEDTGLKVGCLVNNTGYFLPGKTYEEEEGLLESMIRTNLYSAYHLTRKLIPQMIQRKKGHIFNMGSIAGINPYPNGGSYSISKYAMHGYTLNLREETRELGIRVTALNPGATYTASWEGSGIEEERLMPASDIANSVFSAYTLSDRTVVEEIVFRPQLGDL